MNTHCGFGTYEMHVLIYVLHLLKNNCRQRVKNILHFKTMLKDVSKTFLIVFCYTD